MEPSHLPRPAAGWKNNLYWMAATCCGLGYSPILPGTVSALVGAAIYAAIALLAPVAWQTALIGLALLLACFVTVALGDWAEQFFDEKDSGRFVTDEVAGFLCTVLLFRAPSFSQPELWLTLAWTFPFTRVLDMLKVPPARKLEKLPSGWGVLADDLSASLYAAAMLHLLAYAMPAWFGG